MIRPTRLLAPALAAALIGSSALLAGGAPAGAVGPAQPQPDRFHVATFNVLGGSHHAARSGQSRMKGAVRALAKHDVSLVGFQEFEAKQRDAFVRETGGRWQVVGAPGRNGKGTDVRNSIAFEKSAFELVSASHLAITYFHGNAMNIPVVTLRSKATRTEVTMINTHNPADVHGPAQRWRNESTRREVKLVDKLRSQGRTVLLTGDMNEKATFFCKMTRSGQMHAASGGSTGSRCKAPKANGIDWIFGSRDVGFAHWTSDSSTRANGVSDHPIVVAEATLPTPRAASPVPAGGAPGGVPGVGGLPLGVS